jgi:hypothetical protein
MCATIDIDIYRSSEVLLLPVDAKTIGNVGGRSCSHITSYVEARAPDGSQIDGGAAPNLFLSYLRKCRELRPANVYLNVITPYSRKDTNLPCIQPKTIAISVNA